VASGSAFADLTPDANEEFGGFADLLADLGGGLINVDRGFTSAPGLLGAIDLLSTALHELSPVQDCRPQRLALPLQH
jgi:hypothetical protein